MNRINSLLATVFFVALHRRKRREATMKTGVTVSVAFLMLIVLSERPAFAQRYFSLYVGTAAADGGIVRVLDGQSRNIRTEVDKSGKSIGLLMGGRNRRFGLEMLFSFATNDYFAELSDRGRSLSTLDNDLFVFLLGNGVVYLAPGRVVPFVSAGAGVSGTVDNADLAYNYAGGVNIFLTKHIAIRVEVRRFLQNVTTTLDEIVPVGCFPEPGPCELVPIPEPYSERIRITTLNLGLTFSFGR